MKRTFHFVLSLLISLSAIAMAQEVPTLDRSLAYVQDHAKVLTTNEWRELNSLLDAYDQKTTIQIFVAITNADEVPDMPNFTQRMFEAWQPGNKGMDNGIIVHLNIGQRRNIRIHTGYGMEADLPDVLCGRIIDNAMLENIRSKEYGKALLNGVNAIITQLGPDTWQQRVEYKKQVTARQQAEAAEVAKTLGFAFLWILGIGGLAAMIIVPIKRKRFLIQTRAEAVQTLAQAMQKMQSVPASLPGAREAWHFLLKHYPKSAWQEFNGFERILEMLTIQQKTFAGKAEQLLQSNKRADLTQAQGTARQALALANQTSSLVTSIPLRVKDLQLAEAAVPKQTQAVAEKLAKTRKEMQASGVSDTAKDLLAQAEAKFDQAERQQTLEQVNWCAIQVLLTETLVLLDKTLDQVDRDQHPEKYRSSSSSSRSTSFGSSFGRSGGFSSGGGGFGGGRGGMSGGGGAGRSI